MAKFLSACTTCQNRSLQLADWRSALPKDPDLDDSGQIVFAKIAFVPSQDRQAFLAIEPGQPFRLNVLEKLLRVCDDSEAELCSSLREGVRLGVDFDIPPSEHWPLRSDEPELADLVICEGAWRSASDNPTQVRELIASELQEGWIEEYSSLSEIQSKFTSVAVGKLGLVVAE
ncbi:unnamed protein product, partial [Symbiodinium sp. KB8]